MKSYLKDITTAPSEDCKEHRPELHTVAICSLPNHEKITAVCKKCGKKIIAVWKEVKDAR